MAPFRAWPFMAGGMANFSGRARVWAARFGIPVLVAVIFLALELLRGWVLTGLFPGPMLGAVFLIDTPLVQPGQALRAG